MTDYKSEIAQYIEMEKMVLEIGRASCRERV